MIKLKKDKYTAEEIEKAIRMCCRYNVFIPAKPWIVDDVDQNLTSIELEEFLDYLDNPCDE
jgi:hypothetical protein